MLCDDLLWHLSIFLDRASTYGMRLACRAFRAVMLDGFAVVRFLHELRGAFCDAARFWRDRLLDVDTWAHHAAAFRAAANDARIVDSKAYAWHAEHTKALSSGRLRVVVRESEVLGLLLARGPRGLVPPRAGLRAWPPPPPGRGGGLRCANRGAPRVHTLSAR